VLTDLIQLARTVLNERDDGAKNVAAVLAAAAFEDTIRRMGETFAGVIGKDDLASVLTKLKDAEVMKSPQIGTAQSYLSFRNHALHANWEDVQRESVHSILGFVEQLLLKHFS
jgi:nicotinamide mononucleotide adenylyltransferase